MKLAISSQVYLPQICGTTNIIRETSRILIKDYDYDITVHTPNFFKAKAKETIDGVKVRRYPYFDILRNYAVSTPMLRALKKEKSDVIHSYNFGYFPATAGGPWQNTT